MAMIVLPGQGREQVKKKQIEMIPHFWTSTLAGLLKTISRGSKVSLFHHSFEHGSLRKTLPDIVCFGSQLGSMEDDSDTIITQQVCREEEMCDGEWVLRIWSNHKADKRQWIGEMSLTILLCHATLGFQKGKKWTEWKRKCEGEWEARRTETFKHNTLLSAKLPLQRSDGWALATLFPWPQHVCVHLLVNALPSPAHTLYMDTRSSCELLWMADHFLHTKKQLAPYIIIWK